ncbi:MAG: hypothetical protein ACRDD2_03575 [Sarcina sp.]
MRRFKNKIFIITIIMTTLLIGIPTVEIFSEEKLDNKKVLIKAGMPEELIEDISESERKILAEKVENEGGQYVDNNEFYLDENSNSLINVAGNIEEADLKLEYTLWKWNDDRYTIWGSYEWKKRKFNLTNDIFTVFLDENWKIDGATTRYSTYAKNSINGNWRTLESEVESIYDISEIPAGAAWSNLGSFYRIPMYFKGVCEFDIIPITTNEFGNIKLQYGEGTLGDGIKQMSKNYRNINFNK